MQNGNNNNYSNRRQTTSSSYRPSASSHNREQRYSQASSSRNYSDRVSYRSGATTSENVGNKPNFSFKNKHSFSEELKNTFAFKNNLSDYSFITKIFVLICRLFTFIFFGLWFLIKNAFLGIVLLSKKSRVCKAIFILLAIFIVLLIVDFFVFFGKIYPGVRVGDIDLSWKTPEEAKSLVNSKYEPLLFSDDVYIYTSKEAKDNGIENNSGSGINEQLSLDQARKNVKYWKVNASEIEAEFPLEDIVDQAYQSTRGINHVFDKLGVLLFGRIIDPYASFNDSAIDGIEEKINKTIGSVVVNPTVEFEKGNAVAKEGNDGDMVDHKEFENQLNKAFFQKEQSNRGFIANLHHVNQKIPYSVAENMAQILNQVLDRPINFTYKNTNWESKRKEMASWLKISLEEREKDQNSTGCSCSVSNNNCLVANIDENIATADILNHTASQTNNNDYNVTFEKQDKQVMVNTSSEVEIPYANEAINNLQNQWLQNPVIYEKTNMNELNNYKNNEKLSLVINSTNIPKSLKYEDAIRFGIVSEIAHYTTTFSTGSGTENRNHNIALASQYLDNSICKANGGKWSFNEIAGDTTEDKGYLTAGAVVGNMYTKSVGGGVCQVATTVFNAIYEAGLPVVSRSPHKLYIASYPAGRDAAVSYSYPDLVWQNNLQSDILVKVTTNGYSATCTLIGINPQYNVKSEVGEWTPGDKYETIYVVDPSKSANTKYTQTSGADGRSIIVKRSVYDKNGKLISTDEFKSNYKARAEVIVLGPGDEANALLSSKKARMKNDTDNW